VTKVRRVVAVSGLLATATLGLTGIAQAAGTGGVELTPGGSSSAFHASLKAGQTATAQFTLTNLKATPTDIRLYAASASKGGDGGYAVGGPGSAPWISIDDQVVHLAAHQAKRYSFTIARDTAPRGEGLTYGAVVLEEAGGNLVTRAATLVYLDRIGPGGAAPATARPVQQDQVQQLKTSPQAPLVKIGGTKSAASWPYIAAAGLVAIMAGLVPVAARRRRVVTLPTPRVAAEQAEPARR
jgi:hypothetical protein